MPPRQNPFGFAPQPPRSLYTGEVFAPTKGFVDAPDIVVPSGSITSGQNVWIWGNSFQNRPRLQQVGSNTPFADVPTGAWLYSNVEGVEYPMVAAKSTVAYLTADVWTALTYQSTSSTNPPSGTQNDYWFATQAYLPRVDQNIVIMANGVDPLFAAMPSQSTAFSTLTQSPIAKDVVVLQDHVIAWNIRESSSASRLVNRVRWSVRGDAEDWTTTASFAGFEDITDLRGEGTRIFALGNQLVLASTRELWRGEWRAPQASGDQVFTFTPLNRKVGMPWRRAALQTPDGLFFVNQDLMLCHLPTFGGDVELIGGNVQHLLHDAVVGPQNMFLGWHPDANQISLYYNADVGTSSKRAWTLNATTGTLTPQIFGHSLTVGFLAPPTSSSGSTWDFSATAQLQDMTFTYAQLAAGLGDTMTEAVVTSSGTVLGFSHSATSDYGSVVLHEGVFGGLHSEAADRVKFCDTVRCHFVADSASSVSIGVSGDEGASFSEQRIALSAQSNSSQYVTHFGVSGPAHMVRVRAESPSVFELSMMETRAKLGGEVS